MLRKALLLAAFIGFVSCQSQEELKTEQYFAEGYQLFTLHCANCHQADGKGMSNLYPPITASSVLADKSKLACIIRNGMRDTIMVNKKPFSRPMPPNSQLKDLEIAEIITYVNLKWAKDSLYTPISLVQKSLVECPVH